MKPSISPRGRAMPASPIRKLMPVADAAKRRGVHVYHLNIGQPDLPTPEALRSKLAQGGAGALVCERYYTNYNSFATMAGVRLVPLTTRGEDGFPLPPRQAWERAL